MASARPKNICDVPGCGHGRKASHRLCLKCFDRLTPELRIGIMEAHHQRRFADHTALKRRAAAYLNIVPPARDSARRYVPRVTAARAYELNARMMGEQPDA